MKEELESLIDDSVVNDTYCCHHRALGYGKDAKDFGCSENYNCECHKRDKIQTTKSPKE